MNKKIEFFKIYGILLGLHGLCFLVIFGASSIVMGRIGNPDNLFYPFMIVYLFIIMPFLSLCLCSGQENTEHIDSDVDKNPGVLE